MFHLRYIQLTNLITLQRELLPGIGMFGEAGNERDQLRCHTESRISETLHVLFFLTGCLRDKPRRSQIGRRNRAFGSKRQLVRGGELSGRWHRQRVSHILSVSVVRFRESRIHNILEGALSVEHTGHETTEKVHFFWTDE